MDYSAIISNKKWATSNVTFSFMTSVLPNYNNNSEFAATFSPVATAMRNEIASILNPTLGGDPLRPTYFSDVSGLTFTKVVGRTGDIAIGSYEQPDDAPASAFFPGPSTGGDIWLGLDFTTPSALGTHHNFTLLHEIGHAVGLEHGNIYPPSNFPTTLPNLDPKFDSMKYTIMSYNMDPNNNGYYPIGLQQFDIAALQEMYGVNYNTRSGDTVYNFSASPGIMTIWDGGGIDKLDTQAISDNVFVDLQPGHFSWIGGVENVAMALVSHLPTAKQALALIEDAKSGVGDDELTGNQASNALQGGAGTNKLKGLGGDDILVSEGQNDILDGGVGNDALINYQLDGNTQYVFGKGYGHDGILDHAISYSNTNIDILLKDILPGEIKLIFERYDYNNSIPPEQRLPEPDYRYANGYIEISGSQDTLTLPWVYRPEEILNNPANSPFDYSGDSIQFSNGTVWDMQNMENYVTFKDIATADEIMGIDSPIFAWANLVRIGSYLPDYYLEG